MLNPENNHDDGEEEDGNPRNSMLDHCRIFCIIKLDFFSCVLWLALFTLTHLIHIHAHTKNRNFLMQKILLFPVIRQCFVSQAFKNIYSYMQIRARQHQSRKISFINFWLGFTAYFSSSVIPSCVSTFSSIKKFPVHSDDDLRKI